MFRYFESVIFLLKLLLSNFYLSFQGQLRWLSRNIDIVKMQVKLILNLFQSDAFHLNLGTVSKGIIRSVFLAYAEYRKVQCMILPTV